MPISMKTGGSSDKVGDAKDDALEKAKRAALEALGLFDGTGGRDARDVAAKESGISRPNGSPQEAKKPPKRPRVGQVASPSPRAGDADDETNGTIEVIQEVLEIPEEYAELAGVLERFAASGKTEGGGDASDLADDAVDVVGKVKENGIQEKSGKTEEKNVRLDGEADEEAEESAKAAAALSARQARRRQRLTVSQLKALVDDPGAVEQWDVTSSDPLLLVHLKCATGSVPVPVNWRQKRKYLQSKRGMEKTLFKMPQYIEDTGIGAARAALAEAEAAKTAKQKSRERIRPKTSGSGVDIDYSVLRDAFFKFQTKPRLSGHGDVYYELREREVKHESFRPGVLSSTLREALGVGPSDPPPWLRAMQRYGPPPSYPNLEIPGLNAPIPPGASFGLQDGGWGKPPVDQFGRPIYGDVFAEGTKYVETDSRFDLTESEKERRWGEIDTTLFDEEEQAAALRREKRHSLLGDAGKDLQEEENDEVDEDEAPARKEAEEAQAASAGAPTSAAEGAGELGGARGTATGVETPASGIELRKGLAPGQLYSVLEQKTTNVGAGGLMGSTHVYEVGGASGAGESDDDGEGSSPRGKGEALLKKRKADAQLHRNNRDGNEAKKTKESDKSKDFKF